MAYYQYFIPKIVGLIFITTHFSVAQWQEYVTIDLSSYNVADKSTHVFKDQCMLQNYLRITTENVPKNAGFFIVQIHSFQYNITLSYTSGAKRGNFVIGVNTGLVQIINSSRYDFFVTSKNKHFFPILVAVTIYGENDPIPGGCNLTFDTEIAPYQLISYSDALVKVDTQAASVRGHHCEETAVKLEMYHLFLKERDFIADSYFEGLEKMLTVDSILAHGRKVPEPMGSSKLRRYYSAYVGTGAIFAVVASYGNSTSAYVPAASYSCDINSLDSCYEPVSSYWKLICALMLFFGVLTCYFGHYYFKTELFLIGCIVGGLLSYVVVLYNSNLNTNESTQVALIFGIIYGIIWVLFWWKFGIPVLSLSLTVILFGFLVASVTFYGFIGDSVVFENNINFWSMFCIIICVVSMMLLFITLHANILVCSAIGAYAIIISVDHYVGANLRYIVINTVRRATVSDFKFAVIDPPYQTRDMVLTGLWVLLAVSGFYTQWLLQLGKPPFPPPIQIGRSVAANEYTPLLIEPVYS